MTSLNAQENVHSSQKPNPRGKVEVGVAMVNVARELLGVKYTLGGRMRGDDGIDCQGVLFFAAERVQPRRRKCGWKSFSVMPTKTLRDKEFGRPVPHLGPVATLKLDVNLMKPGDIIFLFRRRIKSC
ncbi:MAG: hypothetical protein GY822_04830 [Deltaproteobacteria bacterium]|nr:hypothetical protein [Deltaproteobacteria bacterium]